MIIGLLILALGILFLLENTIPGFEVNFSIIWPTILMVIALNEIRRNKRIDMFNSVLFFIGIWCLLYNINVIPTALGDIFWPIVLILVGLGIVLNSINFKRKHKIIKQTNDLATYYGVFSGTEEKISNDDFKGCNLYAVFGGIELDLRDAKIKGDININVYSIFGGCDLMLPKEYNIIMNSNAIFGGNDNKCNNPQNGKGHTIYINCISIFGGSDFKN